jgi:hypothetical protein
MSYHVVDSVARVLSVLDTYGCFYEIRVLS